MRKKDETLREAILSCAREIIHAEGVDAISIRRIARQVGVATGTFYNYFSNKEDILLALTEEYWQTTLLELDINSDQTFAQQLIKIYAFLYHHIQGSAGMLMSSLQGADPECRARMEDMQEHLRNVLILRMTQDDRISEDIWDETFTMERYADFIMVNLMAHLRKMEPDISFFVEVVERTLYLSQ